jgi:hypothetical protein
MMIFFVVDPSTGDLTHLKAPTRPRRTRDDFLQLLAGLDDDPGNGGPSATADAVAEWEEAVASRDIAA